MASSGSSAAVASEDAAASKSAIRRLQKDLVHLQRSPNLQIAVRPSNGSLLEWHFVLHSLPTDTPYIGGCYHGKIVFPAEYPLSPPSLMMVTPNGRLQVNSRLCLSMTDFHPESWNPAWSVETILVGLLSFFISDTEKGFGSISQTPEVRKKLAAETWAHNSSNSEFVELFPEFSQPPGAREASDAGAPVPAVLAVTFPGQPADLQQSLLDSELSRGPSDGGLPSAAGGRGDEGAEGARSTPASAEAAPRAEGAPGDTAAEAASSTQPEAPVGAGVDGRAGEGERGASEAGERAAEGGAGDGGDDEVPECWICRDDIGEPLIHPCRCIGTMSGVHASCVQQWVAHHRRSALDAAPPRCSVCHEPYAGQEDRPGVGGFVRYICCSGMRQFARLLVFAALALLFQAATVSGSQWPLGLRIPIVAVSALVWLHKLILVTVSVPVGQAAPRRHFWRRFHVSDHRDVGTHCAEALSMVLTLGFWTAVQVVDWHFGAPFIAMILIPLAKVIHGRPPSLRCIRAVFIALMLVVASPLLILGVILKFIYRNPRRVVHPLDAGWHVAVAIAAFPMCLLLPSNVPVLAVWGVHTLLLVVGLVELLLVRRWQWKSGIAWGFALQLTALAAYVANVMCVFPEGIGGKKYTSVVVLGASLVWLLLVTCLTVIVNKALILQYYQIWQQRNGTFTLQVAGGDSSNTQVAPAEDHAQAQLPV
mmetsp:Transcript_57062/g.185480  ORF Transcript_57062/g.185480 Transcript_57062/m.185480 type:complete len:706 (+) Transcript_57062:86-2203(+)